MCLLIEANADIDLQNKVYKCGSERLINHGTQYYTNQSIMSGVWFFYVTKSLACVLLLAYGHTKYLLTFLWLYAVLCPEWKKWWLKHPNLEIIPPIRAIFWEKSTS